MAPLTSMVKSWKPGFDRRCGETAMRIIGPLERVCSVGLYVSTLEGQLTGIGTRVLSRPFWMIAFLASSSFCVSPDSARSHALCQR